MEQNKIVQFVFILVITGFLSIQCKDPDKQIGPCDCHSKTFRKEQKNVEAVVVLIRGNNPAYGNTGSDAYILSTEPRDFQDSSFVVGPNILVPCDSLPDQYQKQGTRVQISYKRKDCYGAMTMPWMHTSFGYRIDLTAISLNTP